MEDIINIGYTQKVYGLDGRLKIKIEAQYIEDFVDCGVLFLEVNGKPLPYFIEEISVLGKQQLLLKLEDVNDRETANTLTSKSISIRSIDIVQTEKVQEGNKTYIDYTIIDKEQGIVGKITSVEEFPQQEMAFLKHKGKEILIPLNDDFIIKIDSTQKEILMDLPLGLLEL